MRKVNIYNKFTILLIVGVMTFGSASTAMAASTTLYSPDALKKAVYNQMVQRSTNFSFSYVGSEADRIAADDENFFKTVYAGSDDYLEWNRERFYYSYTLREGRIDFDFEVDYLTTKAQEAYVDSLTTAALATIIKPQMNDYEKLLAIHQYILDHVSYDMSLTKYSAYNAIVEGESVCQGYALLMDKMLEKAGIKTIIIDGSIPEGSHAWNLVLIDGLWYHVDATNDDTNDNIFFLKTDQYMKDHDYRWEASLFPHADTTFIIPLKVTVMINERLVAFDVLPYINQENRVMVPLRFVSEKLGATVDWDMASKTVTVNNGQSTLIMTIDSNKVFQNGQIGYMDTTAVIKEDRTMVPLRFVSEYLGATVEWDEVNQIAHIYSVE